MRWAVFDRCMADARAAWAWLVPLLRAHLAFEEQALLPRYESLGEFPPNASPRVFRRDHRLILEAIDAVELDGDRVALCDALAKLEGVLEHHDLREAEHFKPRLDAAFDDLGEDLARWAETRASLGSCPTRAHEREELAPPPFWGDALAEARHALAWGDVGTAEARLAGLDTDGHPKARRHATTALRCLQHGSPLEAWDKLKLLAILAAHPPRST